MNEVQIIDVSEGQDAAGRLAVARALWTRGEALAACSADGAVHAVVTVVLQHGDVAREDVDGSACVGSAVGGLAFDDVTGTFVFEVTSKPPQTDASIVAPLKNGMILQVSGDELVVAPIREHLGDVVACANATNAHEDVTVTLRWTEDAHGAVWAYPKPSSKGAMLFRGVETCIESELTNVGAGTVVVVDLQRRR